jgi:RNA recognition motif-containing protein
MTENDSQSPGNPIRLRGLPFSVTENDIRKFLNSYEVVEGSIFLGMNTFRGSPNGEAYAVLASSDVRERALRELDRKQVGHRYIEIFSCSESEYQQAKRKIAGTSYVGSALG